MGEWPFFPQKPTVYGSGLTRKDDHATDYLAFKGSNPNLKSPALIKQALPIHSPSSPKHTHLFWL